MLTLLFTMCTALPLQTADPASRPRQEAAETLRSGIAELRTLRELGSPGLAPLLSRGELATEQLGENHASSRLDAFLEAARWRGVFEPEVAAGWLEAELESFAADLEFEPVLEAELPAGFPAPTPVREIEQKRYPAYRMARAEMSGSGTQTAFWKLFAHIQSNDIAMTAPVELSYTAGADGPRESAMGFLYGTPEVGERGLDGPVEVVDIEPDLVASLGCRGRTSSSRIERARSELLAWIEQRPGLAVAGEVRVMSYNSPRVPSRNRYFEVQIPVRKVESVIDFSSPDEAGRWQAVDDVVMGGRSASRLERTAEGTSAFTGRVSLENGGGFASVRSREWPGGLAAASALVLRCRGDGKTYQLRLRTRAAGEGVSYLAAFPTVPGEWIECAFEASEFIPTWRGRRVSGAPPLDLAGVTSVGLLIADEQEGPFRLELGSLGKR